MLFDTYQSRHQLQDALDADLVTQAHVHMCVSMYNKVTTRTSTYGHELVLPSRRLVHPAADSDFVKGRKAHMDMCLCYQVDV